jgi:hypothetical protein
MSAPPAARAGSPGRAALALAAPLAAAALVAACSSPPRTYLEPVRTRGAAVDISARAPSGGEAEPVRTAGFVPLEYAEQRIRIACEARIAEEEPLEGIPVAMLHLRIWLHNYSRSTVEMRPAEFVARDDIGRRYSPSRSSADGSRTGIVIARAPVRSAVDVLFRLPAGFDVSGARTMTLSWGFRIDDREFRHETTFEAGRDRAFRDPFATYPVGRQ